MNINFPTKPLSVLATCLVISSIAASPQAEAQNAKACSDYNTEYNSLSRQIQAFNIISGAHPLAQRQFAIRDTARKAGCPVGPDAIETNIKATVHNPSGARQNAMNKLCTLWDQADYIGFDAKGPNFAFRFFRHADGTVTGVERKSQTTCLKLVKNATTGRTTIDGVKLVRPNGVVFGVEVGVATKLWGKKRQFHNTWTFDYYN